MHSKRWETAIVFLCWTTHILVLSNMTLETSNFYCSFEELSCRIFNVSFIGPNDRLNTTVLGNRTENILTVKMTNAAMSDFPSNFFVEFAKVQKVNVEFCGLQNLLINHAITSLTDLTLPHNQIQLIANGALKLAPNLRMLELADNKVSLIEEHALKGLHQLSYVDLTNNMIELLPPTLFVDQKNLTSVWLTGNRLKTLDESLFSQNHDLFLLWLDNNMINSLPKRLFHSTPKLYELIMAQNYLLELPDHLLANLSNLCIVDLSYNNIKTVNIEQNLNLCVLRLAHTHVQGFNRSDLSKLEVLNLSKNEFLNMSRVNFSGLMSLKSLYLHSSRLTLHDLRSGLLNGLINLELLDLSGNALGTVDLKMFEVSEKLTELYLNHTQLNEVRNIQLLTSNFLKLQYLDLSGNSFNRSMLATLRQITRHISNVRIDAVNEAKSDNFGMTTPSLLEVIAKYQAESKQFNSQTKKWLVFQSCLLAIICFYALLKMLMIIVRLFRSSFDETRSGRHYLLNDEITL